MLGCRLTEGQLNMADISESLNLLYCLPMKNGNSQNSLNLLLASLFFFFKLSFKKWMSYLIVPSNKHTLPPSTHPCSRKLEGRCIIQSTELHYVWLRNNIFLPYTRFHICVTYVYYMQLKREVIYIYICKFQ